MKIIEFPKKNFKTTLVKRFNELKEGTDGQLTEIKKIMHDFIVLHFTFRSTIHFELFFSELCKLYV